MTERPFGSDLSIVREAGPQGTLTVAIAAAFDFALADLNLDGNPLDLDSSAWVAERYGGRTVLRTDQMDAARDFVAQIRNGMRLEFRRNGQYIPLGGLTAALLRMDERQQRLGTRTALIRTGSASAGTVPAPPPLPVVEVRHETPTMTHQEQEALLGRALAHHSNTLDERCYDAFHLITPVKARIWPIDATRAMAAVPCTVSNIQQVLSLVYLLDRDDSTITVFQPALHFEGQPHTATFWTLPEPDFDPATGRLFASRKERSNADCGYAGEWQWQDGEFALASFTRQDRCGGSGPGNWSVFYRSQVSPR